MLLLLLLSDERKRALRSLWGNRALRLSVRTSGNRSRARSVTYANHPNSTSLSAIGNRVSATVWDGVESE